MKAPGVDVRPLRQMTGDADFNEVFLTDVRIPDTHRVGAVDGGWTVARSVLAQERSAAPWPVHREGRDPRALGRERN